MKTPTRTLPERGPHVADWIERYAACKLEPACDERVEAHLLVCDACFAAYVAFLVNHS